MKEKSTDFVTPIKASREAQEEEFSPTILEAAKTLSKVASQGVSKEKSTDKGKRYRRRARLLTKLKNKMRQEEAGLEEAKKLQAQLDEEVVKQIHFDKMVAQRMAKEEALSEQQKKRKAQVQFEAQFYTKEDWDAKLTPFNLKLNFNLKRRLRNGSNQKKEDTFAEEKELRQR
ncbi:hypothetical protein Tco_0968218 [Tanacetum coccineum]